MRLHRRNKYYHKYLRNGIWSVYEVKGCMPLANHSGWVCQWQSSLGAPSCCIALPTFQTGASNINSAYTAEVDIGPGGGNEKKRKEKKRENTNHRILAYDQQGDCHTPSWLNLVELSHMHIHLMMDCDSTQLMHCHAWAMQNILQPSHLRHLQTSPDRQGQCADSMHTTFIHPIYSILWFT